MIGAGVKTKRANFAKLAHFRFIATFSGWL